MKLAVIFDFLGLAFLTISICGIVIAVVTK